jgi:DNA-binding IclR family transcriptional regulator
MRRPGSKSSPVGVIGKVLRILELLDQYPSGLQLKDIAAMTRINKSTAHRFLSHLQAENYLFRDSAGTYMLGTKLARLGAGPSFHATLCRICRPTLEDLRAATDETVNLAVLEGAEIVYVDVLESQQPFKMVSPAGMRRLAHRTSLGKAILANMEDCLQKEEIISLFVGMPDKGQKATSVSRLKKELMNIREQGFSLDDEESVIGARCVGSAIFDAKGTVIGAISLSGPVVRITKGRLPFFSAAVSKAAREISWHLGHRLLKGEKAANLTAEHPRKSGPFR